MGLFTDLCDTIASAEVPLDYIRLKAFRFSIDGRAALWFKTLPARSIFTWKQLYDLFMNKYFPAWKTTELRAEIHAFRQRPNESLSDVWERYKLLIASCPTHGQPMYLLLQVFY